MLTPNTTPPEKRKAVRAGNAAPGPPRVNGQLFEELRHRCRNPRCRSKLLAPVGNPREAFCTRGCHSSFYRKRCLVCEREMERRNERQLVCGKRRCRNALQARQSLGRYLPSSDGVSTLENSIKPGIKIDGAVDRPWRIVAGAALSDSAFHCAAVGGAEAVEAVNRTNVRSNLRYWREANAKPRPTAPAVIAVDVTAQSHWAPSWQPHWQSSDDDLSIPDFLRR